ncbi:hypothetical protein FDA94_00645 [Herbidospora galbida]|uniref:Uncharacterized protein n=1 Tax=Herbidospora galbida TaxID=2575442 RepID=A0A4U3MR16_9ACTN|nr:hypothetical protein [Herbidospora galbida]TKK91349.1 hypothetical protein FDA94_00645 [Herbidospora galbida]
MRVAGPARANFRAGRLASYAFGVEAAIGNNPMRYLFARRFSASPERAVTAIFVIKPDVLFGTYVWMEEERDAGECRISTYLPTMRRPIQVVDRLAFDCLPLTDIGYVDLMAWPHPVLQLSGAGEPGTGTRVYRGPARLDALVVRECSVPGTGVVVDRVVEQRGEPIRRWEALELGGQAEDWLPRRVRVSRLDSGHWTDFTRSGPAVPLACEDFDDSPETLREAVENALAGAEARR